MIKLLSSFLLCLLIASIIVIAASILNSRHSADREKHSPFECGFDPLKNSRMPLSLRFFLLAVLFLVFDIEIVFIIPIPSMIISNDISEFMAPLLPLLIILLFGLLHEWNEGALKWSP